MARKAKRENYGAAEKDRWTRLAMDNPDLTLPKLLEAKKVRAPYRTVQDSINKALAEYTGVCDSADQFYRALEKKEKEMVKGDRSFRDGWLN